MKRLLLAAVLSLFASRAHAGYPPYIGNTPPANGIITQYVSGKICLAASSGTAGTCAILLDGTTGKVTGVSFSTTAVIGSTSAVYIDGSLYGAGTSGSPIGVRSSSVAVLVGGLVRNANLDSSSVTLQGNAFNAASQLVQLNGSAQLPAVDGSLLTGLNATSTVTANVSLTGLGSANNPLGVNSASGTLQGNAFNAANQLVKLNNSTQLPAVDGSLLTGINGTVFINANQGLVGNGSALNPLGTNSSIVTQQGNAFNGPNQLIETTGGGYYPALNGSLITGINGSVAGGVAGQATYWTGAVNISPYAYENYYSSGVVFSTNVVFNSTGVTTFNSSTTFNAPAAFAGQATFPSGSTVTIQGYAMQDIFIGSYTFSGVNVGTITLVSTGTYLNYRIVGSLVNAAGAAQNLFIKVGTDTSSAYSMSSLTAGSAGTAYDQGCAPGKRALANGGSGFNPEWYQSAHGDVDIDVRQLTSTLISIKSRSGSIPYTAAPSPSADILNGNIGNLYYGSSFMAYGTIALSFGTWSSCTAITDTGGALTGSVWVYARGAER